MISFKEVNNVNELESYKDYYPILETASLKHKFLIDNQGRSISSSHVGAVYRLLGDYGKDFTLIERIVRTVFGIFAVLLTLGMSLLFQTVKNLFTLNIQVIRFGILELGPLHQPTDLQRGYRDDIELDMIHKLAGITKVDKQGKLVEKIYHLDKKVGEGGYGTAFELIPIDNHGKHKVLKVTHEEEILKACPKLHKSKEIIDKQFVNPITGTAQNVIPGVLNYKHIDATATKGLAVSKFCSGDMLSILPMEHPFNFYCKYIAETAFAINHLHTESAFKPGLVHRDIKPENILYQEDGESPHFFVIDYDGADETNALGRRLTYTKRYLGMQDRDAWKKDSKNIALNMAMDVRLLGLSWAEVLTKHWFTHDDNLPAFTLTMDFLTDAIFTGRKWTQAEKNSLNKICDLIVKMTNPDWSLRPKMKECLEDLASFGLEIPQYKI